MTSQHAADWYNRGNALYFQNQLDEAVSCYQEALRLSPDDAGLCGNLGLVLRHMGRLDESITFCRRAVQLQPNLAATHINLALSLTARKQFDEAVRHGREAVRLQPDFAPAHHCLGYALLQQRRWEESVAALQTALHLNPNLSKGHSNLGEALVGLGRFPEALVHFRQALQLQPELTEALIHQAYCLWQIRQFEAATECVMEWLRREPNSAEGYRALSIIAMKEGRLDEAIAHLDHVLALKADDSEAHFNRALAFLLQGDYQRGWPELEWRWQCEELHPRRGNPGTWDGLPLAGRTVLLRVEQGMGDTLQFIRFAPLLKQQGATVILACYPALMSLVSRCNGIDQVIDEATAPLPFDVEVPLMSLPGKLGITLDRLPATVPYLFADRALEASWRRELSRIAGFKIGIAWQGNRDHPNDALRSVSVTRYAPLAQPDVSLISLQQGTGREQLATSGLPIIELPPRPGEVDWSFDDSAAVIKSLDLVITVDSAVAHLAGGLGVPVWVALPFAPDWRWLLNREDSPWYPTMRLFRQKLQGDWDNVFQRIAAELDVLIRHAQSQTPV